MKETIICKKNLRKKRGLWGLWTTNKFNLKVEIQRFWRNNFRNTKFNAIFFLPLMISNCESEIATNLAKYYQPTFYCQKFLQWNVYFLRGGNKKILLTFLENLQNFAIFFAMISVLWKFSNYFITIGRLIVFCQLLLEISENINRKIVSFGFFYIHNCEIALISNFDFFCISENFLQIN